MTRTPLALLLVMLVAAHAHADTVAWWRFEEGPADAPVAHPDPPFANGDFNPAVLDASGNQNHLSAWSEVSWASVLYRADAPASTIPLTGQNNTLAVQNGGEHPSLFTAPNPTGLDLHAITPQQWTIEASFLSHAPTGLHRTFVGRDAHDVAAHDARLAALYFQTVPDGRVAIKFTDLDGNWHDLFSPDPIAADTWYNVAAVSNGAELRLYLNGARVAQTSLGNGNTALAAAGPELGWSILRGFWNQEDTDRWFGLVDEVRISNAALEPADFLFPGGREAALAVDPLAPQLAEAGPALELTFSLTGDQPTHNVTINLDDLASLPQLTISPASLTFSPSNWQTPQSVTLTAIDDNRVEGPNHAATIALNLTSADPAYAALELDPLSVTILDNDCGSWGFHPADLDRNCTVDLADLAQLSQTWLQSTTPNQ